MTYTTVVLGLTLVSVFLGVAAWTYPRWAPVLERYYWWRWLTGDPAP